MSLGGIRKPKQMLTRGGPVTGASPSNRAELDAEMAARKRAERAARGEEMAAERERNRAKSPVTGDNGNAKDVKYGEGDTNKNGIRDEAGKADFKTGTEVLRDKAIEEAKRHSKAKADSGAEMDGGDEDEELDALAQMRADHDSERKAAADELKSGKAKALQDADARAGLGGLGLSGGTSALKSDIGRTQDRSAVLAMGDFDRKQRDEEFNQIQRQIALADLESAEDVDMDGDGFIAGRPVGGKTGDGDPNNDPASSPEEQEAKTDADVAKVAAKIQAGLGGNGTKNDPFGGIGGAGVDALEDLVGAGLDFTEARAETGTFNRETYVYCKGADGKFYKFKCPEGVDTQDEVEVWFASLTGSPFPTEGGF